MKLSRKNLGRIATTFLATAMLASLTAVPAFATDGTTGQFTGETFTITKTLNVPENVYTPSKSFTFNVVNASESNQPLTTDESNKGIQYGSGEVGSTADATFTVNNTETGVGSARSVVATSAAIQIDVDKYTHAGVYKYVVTEEDDQDANFKYDDNVLILYVHIKNDADSEHANKLSVEMVELVDPNGGTSGGAAKAAGFTNDYGKDDDEEDTLHDLTLTKKIDGTGANLNGEFTFTVAITNDIDDDAQIFKYWNDANGNGVEDDKETGYITANASSGNPSFKLSHDETVVIYGLRDGDTYTITEANVNENGVTSDNYSVYVGVNAAPNKEGDKCANGTTSDTLEDADSDVTVTYLNQRDSVSPTGIAMDIAPYALLVVIAAAGCFVFLRKRNED